MELDMQEPKVNRAFIRKLAANIRSRTGAEVKHTDLIADIASAFGQKPDTLMHALKQREKKSATAMMGDGTPAAAADDGEPGWVFMKQVGAMKEAERFGFKLLMADHPAVFWKKNLCGTSNMVGDETEIYLLVTNEDAPKRSNIFSFPEWSCRLVVGDHESTLLTNNGQVDLAPFNGAATNAVRLLPWTPNPEMGWTAEQVEMGGVRVSNGNFLGDVKEIFDSVMHVPFAKAQDIAGIESGDVADLFYAGDNEMLAFIAFVKAMPPGNWETFDQRKILGALRHAAPKRLNSLDAVDTGEIATEFAGDLAEVLGIPGGPDLGGVDAVGQFAMHIMGLLDQYLEFEKSYASKSAPR
jgi:hypothetical protein